MCFNGIIKADNETFRVKYMGSAGGSGVKITPSTIPFGTENVKMLFGNLYTTGDVWTNNERTIGGAKVYTVNCSRESNPLLANGDRPYGKVPAKGCYYQFTPLKNGNLNVKLVIRTESEGNLYIIDEAANSISDASCVLDDGTPLVYNAGNAFTIINTAKAYRLLNCSFNVTAGTTYYVYIGASRPGFAGYDFIPEGAKETFLFAKTSDETNKYVGTSFTFDNENVTLTSGEDGTADATKQWKWEERMGYVVYSSGNNPSPKSGVPTSGCFTKYAVKNNGKLVVKIITKNNATDNKHFSIVDVDGNMLSAVCMTSEGKRINSNEDGTYTLPGTGDWVLTTCEFDVQSGKDYYVYGNGTKLGYAGYDFIPAGTAESLAVESGKTPGRNYQTLTRAEEKEAQKNNTLPSSLSQTPALFITLGQGTWTGPTSIKEVHNPANPNEYVLNSHFEYEIIPSEASIPTDGRPTSVNDENVYTFDGNANKSLPVTGAFYTITAMKTGTVYLYFDKTDKAKFGKLWITDAKGNPVEEYPNGIYDGSKGVAGGMALENKTQSFMFKVTAGTTYYVFNSEREWTETKEGVTTTYKYNDPNRIRLAGVIYSDGETNITDTYFYSIMRGNVHEVGDQIKTPGMVMTFGGQDKMHNIYTMAKQDDCFVAYEDDSKVELQDGYATAGNINPGDELSDTSADRMNHFVPNKNTHSLPYYGTFYKFEPSCSGELTIHVLQNGALDFDKDGKVIKDEDGNVTLKVRPLYIADEKGNIVEVKEVKVNGKLKLAHNDPPYNFTDYNNYDLFKEAWEAAKVGENFGVSKTADGTGYLLINKAYCKYILEVKPGKTYFIFTNASKVGFCGYKFIPAGATPLAQTLDDTNTAQPPFTENQDVTVTYKRTFTEGVWTPVTLPFSMTETQVENTFGEGTMVIYFDGIDGNTIKFKKHKYQMIVAGRPCFVKPGEGGSGFVSVDDAAVAQTMTINGTDVTFTPSLANVTIDGATIEPDKNGEESGTLNGKFNFTLTPSYTKMEKALKTNDYYFGGDGKLYRTQDGENWDVKGYRSFFKCSNNTPGVQAVIANANFGEDGGTTSIEGIEAGNTAIDNANVVIYDLSGRMVKTGTEGLKDLVKGVYVVNGKKVTVK